MKINSLTLKNIGPYAGLHTLDFDELNGSLFLITGPTGAGKTYIFDSICYALYGQTSGEVRTPKDLRSKYAKSESDEAYVELFFTFQKKKYHVLRVVPYIHWKKNRTTKELEVQWKSMEHLWVMENGADKLVCDTGVSSEIKRLFNLDYNQFKMTMMIAQGDFYSLINANTSDREAIFRKILNTSGYASFAEKTKELLDECKEAFRTSSDQMSECRKRISFPSPLNEAIHDDNRMLSVILPDMDAEMKREKEESESAQRAKDEARAASSKKHEEISSAEKEKELHDSYLLQAALHEKLVLEEPSVKEAEARLDSAKKASLVLNAKKSLDKASYDVSVTENAIKDKERYLDVEGPRLLQMETSLGELKKEASDASYDVKISNLDAKLSLLEEYRSELSRCSALEKDASLWEQKVSSDKEALKTLEDSLEPYEEILKKESVEPKKAELEGVLDGKNKEIRIFSSKISLVNDYVKEAGKYQDAVLSYKMKADAEASAAKAYRNYDAAYHAALAGILALTLKENEPCPVCGSIHHPNPSALHEEMSKEELKRLNEEAATAKAEAEGAKARMEEGLLALNKSKSLVQEFLNAEFTPLSVNRAFQDALHAMKDAVKPLSDEIRSLEAEVLEYKTAKQMSDKLKKDADVLKERITSDSSMLIKTEASLNERRESLSRFDSVKDMKKTDLTSERERISVMAENLKNRTALAEENLAKLKTNMASSRGILENLKEALLKHEEERKSQESSLRAVLQTSGFGDVSSAEAAFLDEPSLKTLENEISSYNERKQKSLGRLESFKMQHADTIILKDMDALNAELQALDQKLAEAELLASGLKATYDSNQREMESLHRLFASSSALETRYNDAKRLYDVANGMIPGKKITFEVYYQRQVFDEILRVAGYKFRKMTNGRFEMEPGVPADRKSPYGLEIAVRDTYNGESRPVSGLSGGESFMASMSLALAFSEIIQTKAGGVELDSMFIDEGFGTLDNEMLENTKKCLLETGSGTSRRIGIISHIAELENSIPSKVVVQKGENGSSFKVINQ